MSERVQSTLYQQPLVGQLLLSFEFPATLHSTFIERSAPEPNVNTTLDPSALVLYFPAPHTVTGEDVLELHVHGGAAIVRSVLAAIQNCNELNLGEIRYANPGEFTERAFLNDRLDLTQVEALGDTLAATTEQQRLLAVRGTVNNLAKRYESWRQQLLYARGELEALIDFSEDQHFDESPSDLCASVADQVRSLKRMIQIQSQNAVRGELLRNGITIALLGAPNAGKSSLLNHIVGREAAIVSQEAGTTRDVIEVGLDLGGYFCRVGDTAGLRNTEGGALHGSGAQEIVGQVEQEGMRRAKSRAAESDVVIVVLSFEDAAGKLALQLDAEVIATSAKLVASKDNVLVVINKKDMAPSTLMLENATQEVLGLLPGLRRDKIFWISCKDADTRASGRPSDGDSPDPGHIQAFLQGLIRHFGELTKALVPQDAAQAGPDPSVWQESLGGTARQHVLLEECLKFLDAFLVEVERHDPADGLENEADIVVAAEHLRGAADCLAKITGRGSSGDVEEVLGVVFEKFCVGK
ncbi:hypothetical protein M433DRAFT_331419 [Acidomyces richmondensis BFW]|nr:MAG: hypothetical protein FE78DRAFT_512463 [Acidomyces sp. 'richmondensis']KYG49226.1 hypothetical protein M433DRAFT_331419 [Acidomyces richmondensis BFW]